MAKSKVLFVGSADSVDAASTLLQKMTKVAAKGIQVAFGSCSNTDAFEKLKEGPIPIPLYLQDTYETLLASPSKEKEPSNDEEETPSENPCHQVVDNLFLLRDHLNTGPQPQLLVPGMWRIPIGDQQQRSNHLVVASVPPQFRESKEFFERTTEHVSYTGCDILLSTEWPQGIEKLLPPATSLAIQKVYSYDITSLALQVRAHYHISFSAPTSFVQTPAFCHAPAVTTTLAIRHTGRFLALGSVGGTTKWVHAVAMEPIHQEATLGGENGEAAAPCPYLDLVEAGASTTTGLSQETARKLIAQDRGARMGKRGRDEPVDPDNLSLFVYGLHQDVTRRLQQNDESLLSALSGSVRVRRPNGAAFAFVDFVSHEAASLCLGEQTILGVKLTLRWANNNSARTPAKRQRMGEADAKDSSTIYFNVSGASSDQAEPCTASAIGETLRQLLEETLEKALGDGIKASEEPALQVKLRVPESQASSFGFCDFASHAAASMALATLTGSTDGGRVQQETIDGGPLANAAVLHLHWARPLQEGDIEDKNIVELDGFKFERRHFPADSRSDCWFCLASSDCEKHLIVGVYDSFYAAMPKGPVHRGHVLLVPVHHSSEGVLLDDGVAQEMDVVKQDLRRHADKSYDAELFVFERAVETKGGYHSHVQCVPVSRGLGDQLETAMRQQLGRLGIDLREVTSEDSIRSLVPEEGQYFYAEIPTSSSTVKRFLVLENTKKIPLQFGREVIALVLKNPGLAHWKNESCLLDKAKETEYAIAFRESFDSCLRDGSKAEEPS